MANANLCGIPITEEYTYLGVTINNAGSIEPQINRI